MNLLPIHLVSFIRLVKNILHHKLAEVIALDGNISLVEFYPPKSWVGKQLSDLDLRKDYDLNLIGLQLLSY